jgi:parallel beta-helix repeat protein
LALTANTVWEVRTAGSDTNGGAFDATIANHGTDYSQQDAANTVGNNISTTDAVAAGTTTITSATASFTSAIIGNVIYLAGGTGSLAATRVQVTAFTNSTTVTVDATVAAGTGITMNIGGALLSPAIAAAFRVVGNTVWIKAGTYSVTTASTNVAGGCVSDATGGAVVTWEGYNSTRGDLGTAPILQAGNAISTFTVFAVTSGSTAGSIIRNITVDGAGLTGSQGFSLQRRGTYYQLTAKNCKNIGINATGNNVLVKCVATNVTGGAEAILCSQAYFCEAYSNTVPGFATSVTGAVFWGCLSYGNSGSTSDGFQLGSSENSLINCVAYNNGRDGFRWGSGESNLAINCIAEGTNAASTTGFNATSAAIGAGVTRINCAAYNNATNVSANITGPAIGNVTGTTTFFVNAGSNNFALNSTSTGGGLLRALGIPGAFPAASSTGYIDIGAVQSPPMAPLSRAFTGF